MTIRRFAECVKRSVVGQMHQSPGEEAQRPILGRKEENGAYKDFRNDVIFTISFISSMCG